MLGETQRIKGIKRTFAKQVAAELDVDTAYISKWKTTTSR